MLRPLTFVCLAAALPLFPPARAGTPLIHGGETLAFLGDSITQFGAQTPGGYVHLVESGLAANGVAIKIIPAGISGNKSDQMLARLDRDVLNKKPAWMTLSCGVNDVWHGARGVPLEDYKKNITGIVDRCRAAGVKVMILTSTQIGLPVTNANNTKLAGYNDFLHALARERHLPLADLNADMAAEEKTLAEAGVRRPLTVDGVHMNMYGNIMMAKGVLRAFGLDDAQLATAEKAWRGIPDAEPVTARLKISMPEMEALETLAAGRKQSVDALLTERLGSALKAMLAEGKAGGH